MVQLKWLEFGLEQTMRCRRDYVKVYENYMTTSREELGMYVRIVSSTKGLARN